MIAFLIGIAASTVVGYVVYRRQQTDATVSEQRIAFLMEQALKESRGASEALHSTIAIVSEQQRELQDDFAQLRANFASALQTLSQRVSRPAIGRARRRAESLRLTRSDLQRLHQELMPSTVPHAGELRTAKVMIGGSLYKPPEPATIAVRIDAMLADWNAMVEGLDAVPRLEQIRHMAKFHHDLLSIHPFADGNGAVARTLLSMQLRTLVGDTKPLVLTERRRYFDALQAADSGDLAPLERIVAQLVDETAAYHH